MVTGSYLRAALMLSGHTVGFKGISTSRLWIIVLGVEVKRVPVFPVMTQIYKAETGPAL